MPEQQYIPQHSTVPEQQYAPQQQYQQPMQQVPQQPQQYQQPAQQIPQYPPQQSPEEELQQYIPQQPTEQSIQQQDADNQSKKKGKGFLSGLGKGDKKTINAKRPMNINIEKLQKDKDIKTINVKGDLSAVPLIGNVKKSKKKLVGKYISGSILFIVAAVIIVFCINVAVNYKIVQGNIMGKDFAVAGFSFVNRDYDPYNRIYDGAKIYYSDTSSKDKLIEFAGDFKMGAVAKLYSDKVAIGENGIREIVIQKDQVRYILEEGQ